jgi:ketosteroid isomerase-like protein
MDVSTPDSSTMRPQLSVWILALFLAGCDGSRVSADQRQAITAAITREVKDAYDLSKPDVAKRLLSLYPDTGRVISASGGRIFTSRDTLAMGIKAFWDYVGSNMRDPKWIWDQMIVDVVSPSAAVMTASYHVPHHTPRGEPHTIAGAWTALFEKRGDRWVIVQEHLSDLPMTDAMAMPPGMKMP